MRIASIAAILLTTSGCFAELTANGNRAGGGVSGWGGGLGVSLGVAYDINDAFRGSLGGDARVASNSGTDGSLGTKSLGLLGRGDLLLAENFRGTFAYSYGYMSALTFVHDSKEYKGDGTVHSLYLGGALDSGIKNGFGL